MSARWLTPVAVVVLATFIAVGFVGVDRYGTNYWLYRGFPPPHDPAFVTQRGSVEHSPRDRRPLGRRLRRHQHRSPCPEGVLARRKLVGIRGRRAQPLDLRTTARWARTEHATGWAPRFSVDVAPFAHVLLGLHGQGRLAPS